MATRSSKTLRKQTDPQPTTDIDSRQWIATTAYYKAEARGFTPGSELEDWLEAEREFELQFTTKTR